MPENTTDAVSSFTAALQIAGFSVAGSDLAAVHAAQSQVSLALLSVGAGAQLARLPKADLLETLLLRAVPVIREASTYQQATDSHLRTAFMAVHLELALIGWAKGQVKTVADQQVLAQAEGAVADAFRALRFECPL